MRTHVKVPSLPLCMAVLQLRNRMPIPWGLHEYKQYDEHKLNAPSSFTMRDRGMFATLRVRFYMLKQLNVVSAALPAAAHTQLACIELYQLPVIG